MTRAHFRTRLLALLVSLVGASAAFADDGCEEDARSVQSATDRHFVVLAGRKGVFYDGGGPAFVALIDVDAVAQETETGAVGIYADERNRRVFGAVPPEVYDEYLKDSDDPADVMLRLEVTGKQHARVLDVLRTWDRRAREGMLLYPDLAMNAILFVKQATDALNRCAAVIDLYALDWGIQDSISDDNPPGLVPLLFFEELERRNASLHVTDQDMPEGLPLSASASLSEGAAR